METVNVYSPVEDKKIRTEFQNSPIWKKHIPKRNMMKTPDVFLYGLNICLSLKVSDLFRLLKSVNLQIKE